MVDSKKGVSRDRLQIDLGVGNESVGHRRIWIVVEKAVEGHGYLLVIHYGDSASDDVRYQLNKLKYAQKSKTINKGIIELIVEIKLRGDNTASVQNIRHRGRKRRFARRLLNRFLNSIGYRFAVNKATHEQEVAAASQLDIRLELENKGAAPFYFP